MITFKALCKAFQLYPSHVYQLEARGILPFRVPREPITADFIRALADHRRKAGPLPDAAVELLAEMERAQ